MSAQQDRKQDQYPYQSDKSSAVTGQASESGQKGTETDEDTGEITTGSGETTQGSRKKTLNLTDVDEDTLGKLMVA